MAESPFSLLNEGATNDFDQSTLDTRDILRAQDLLKRRTGDEAFKAEYGITPEEYGYGGTRSNWMAKLGDLAARAGHWISGKTSVEERPAAEAGAPSSLARHTWNTVGPPLAGNVLNFLGEATGQWGRGTEHAVHGEETPGGGFSRTGVGPEGVIAPTAPFALAEMPLRAVHAPVSAYHAALRAAHPAAVLGNDDDLYAGVPDYGAPTRADMRPTEWRVPAGEERGNIYQGDFKYSSWPQIRDKLELGMDKQWEAERARNYAANKNDIDQFAETLKPKAEQPELPAIWGEGKIPEGGAANHFQANPLEHAKTIENIRRIEETQPEMGRLITGGRPVPEPIPGGETFTNRMPGAGNADNNFARHVRLEQKRANENESGPYRVIDKEGERVIGRPPKPGEPPDDEPGPYAASKDEVSKLIGAAVRQTAAEKDRATPIGRSDQLKRAQEAFNAGPYDLPVNELERLRNIPFSSDRAAPPLPKKPGTRIIDPTTQALKYNNAWRDPRNEPPAIPDDLRPQTEAQRLAEGKEAFAATGPRFSDLKEYNARAKEIAQRARDQGLNAAAAGDAAGVDKAIRGLETDPLRYFKQVADFRGGESEPGTKLNVDLGEANKKLAVLLRGKESPGSAAVQDTAAVQERMRQALAEKQKTDPKAKLSGAEKRAIRRQVEQEQLPKGVRETQQRQREVDARRADNQKFINSIANFFQREGLNPSVAEKGDLNTTYIRPDPTDQEWNLRRRGQPGKKQPISFRVPDTEEWHPGYPTHGMIDVGGFPRETTRQGKRGTEIMLERKAAERGVEDPYASIANRGGEPYENTANGALKAAMEWLSKKQFNLIRQDQAPRWSKNRAEPKPREENVPTAPDYNDPRQGKLLANGKKTRWVPYGPGQKKEGQYQVDYTDTRSRAQQLMDYDDQLHDLLTQTHDPDITPRKRADLMDQIKQIGKQLEDWDKKGKPEEQPEEEEGFYQHPDQLKLLSRGKVDELNKLGARRVTSSQKEIGRTDRAIDKIGQDKIREWIKATSGVSDKARQDFFTQKFAEAGHPPPAYAFWRNFSNRGNAGESHQRTNPNPRMITPGQFWDVYDRHGGDPRKIAGELGIAEQTASKYKMTLPREAPQTPEARAREAAYEADILNRRIEGRRKATENRVARVAERTQAAKDEVAALRAQRANDPAAAQAFRQAMASYSKSPERAAAIEEMSQKAGVSRELTKHGGTAEAEKSPKAIEAKDQEAAARVFRQLRGIPEEGGDVNAGKRGFWQALLSPGKRRIDAAIDEIRRGRSVADVAAEHGVPTNALRQQMKVQGARATELAPGHFGGAKRISTPELIEKIDGMIRDGMTHQEVADELSDESHTFTKSDINNLRQRRDKIGTMPGWQQGRPRANYNPTESSIEAHQEYNTVDRQEAREAASEQAGRDKPRLSEDEGDLYAKAKGAGLVAAFRVGDKTYTGSNHGEAYDKALEDHGGGKMGQDAITEKLLRLHGKQAGVSWADSPVDGFFRNGKYYTRREARALLEGDAAARTGPPLTSEELHEQDHLGYEGAGEDLNAKGKTRLDKVAARGAEATPMDHPDEGVRRAYSKRKPRSWTMRPGREEDLKFGHAAGLSEEALRHIANAAWSDDTYSKIAGDYDRETKVDFQGRREAPISDEVWGRLLHWLRGGIMRGAPPKEDALRRGAPPKEDALRRGAPPKEKK